MKRLSITLTDSQAEALERIAAETGATRQSMIGLAVSAWIRENEHLAALTENEPENEPQTLCEVCGAPATGGCIGPDGQHAYCEEHRYAFEDMPEREEIEREIDRRDALADKEDAAQLIMMSAPKWAGWCRTWTKQNGTVNHERKLFDTYEQAVNYARALAARYHNSGYDEYAEPDWEPCDNDGVPIPLPL